MQRLWRVPISDLCKTSSNPLAWTRGLPPVPYKQQLRPAATWDQPNDHASSQSILQCLSPGAQHTPISSMEST